MLLETTRKDLIDSTILFLMYLQLVILEFFGLSQLMNKVVTLLILVRVLFPTQKEEKRTMLLFPLLIVLFAASCLTGRPFSAGTAKSNFLMLFYPFVYTYYLFYLCSKRPEFMNAVADKLFWFLNAAMVLNLAVISVQIIHPYSIVAKVTSVEIDYVKDTMSGLFAYGATHVISLFTAAAVIYNFSYCKKLENIRWRTILFAYNIMVILYSLVLALFNDNKALFLIMPIAVVMYWFADKEHKDQRLNRIILSACLLPVLFFFAYSFSGTVRRIIDENIVSLLELIVDSVHMGNQAYGSGERIAILLYAVQKSSTWLLGRGFGASGFYAEGFEGFGHFGQADLGTLLILGGIWFTLLLIIVYLKMFRKIIGYAGNNHMIDIAVAVIMIMSLLYTQCVTRTNCILCILLLVLAYRKRFKDLDDVRGKRS